MIDPARLARAIHLDVDVLDGGRRLVSGGEHAHMVLDVDRVPQCDCDDFRRGRVANCKHVLAAQLSALEPSLVAALRALVPEPSAAGLRTIAFPIGPTPDARPRSIADEHSGTPAREGAVRRAEGSSMELGRE